MKKQVACVVSALGILLASIIPVSATTWYVDASRPNDSGAGTAWGTAKQTIQAAINIANSGDTILVASGTYAPISVTNKTLLIQSQYGAASTIINGGGSRCASLATNEIMAYATLDGFTLQNGSAGLYDGGGARYGILKNCILKNNAALSGGGAAYARLENCTVMSNSSSYYGGGTYYCDVIGGTVATNTGGNMDGGGIYAGWVSNCTIIGNTVNRYGGGAAKSDLYDCTVLNNQSRNSNGGGGYEGIWSNCTVSGNTAKLSGGGSYGGTLIDCTVQNNQAGNGGGAYMGSLTRCVVNNNTANNGGGAYDATLQDCLVINNTAVTNGGGACRSTISAGWVFNCVVSNNTARRGGGVYNNWVGNSLLVDNLAIDAGGGAFSAILTNCTVVANMANTNAPGVISNQVYNSIIWDNTYPGGTVENVVDSTLAYSCSLPLAVGTGNISTNPLFVNPIALNFQLQKGSACIDAGTNAYVRTDWDLAGKPRIGNNCVDMGAYEAYFATALSPVPVPYEWLDTNWDVVGGDYEAAAMEDTGKGTQVWQDYVVGTNPKSNEVFKVTKFYMSNSVPVVEYWPSNVVGRTYTLAGTTNLSTTNKWNVPTNTATFFRVEVELNED